MYTHLSTKVNVYTCKYNSLIKVPLLCPYLSFSEVARLTPMSTSGNKGQPFPASQNPSLS